jgi:hypothetical protein
MRAHLPRLIGAAAAALFLASAGTAQAQGKGHGKDKDKDKGHDRARVESRGGEVVYDPRYPRTDARVVDPRYPRTGGRVVDPRFPRTDPRNGGYDPRYDNRNVNRIPPGLAKKPGGMPPGQYKKRYRSDQGGVVLREVLVRRGYPVVRYNDVGSSEYVYYRMPDGTLRRAIVSPGTNQLQFNNVPSSLLSEILARLY